MVVVVVDQLKYWQTLAIMPLCSFQWDWLILGGGVPVDVPTWMARKRGQERPR